MDGAIGESGSIFPCSIVEEENLAEVSDDDSSSQSESNEVVKTWNVGRSIGLSANLDGATIQALEVL